MEKIVEILNLINNGNFASAKLLLDQYFYSSDKDIYLETLIKIFFFEETRNDNNKLKMLNLGCGSRFHPSWVNIDFQPSGEDVIAHNLLNGIPFENESFDVVYHSHLLEHFPKRYAPYFLKECFRVLKPGGVIRIVVPDLEQIVREYLENLEGALEGNPIAATRYEWIILELLDQMVREKSGGEMLEFWKQFPLPCEDYIIQRVGSEAKNNIEQIRKSKQTISPEDYKNLPFKPNVDPTELGKFRLSGEVHQWMYDRYSLRKLLEEAGFINIEQVDAYTSKIPNFKSFHLDTNPDGSVRKPDSLFMEAQKPFSLRNEEKNRVVSKESYSPKIPINKQKLNVVHLSVWDTGGAGTAALRLHLGLLRLGVNSNFLTIYKQTNSPNVIQVERKSFAKNWSWSDYFNWWYKYLKQHYPNRPQHFEFFSSVKSITDFRNNELIQNADIINFHWISSMVDFEEDLEIFKGKKIVWTLHDENAFTGGCHFTSGCDKYQTACNSCPQLFSLEKFDLSYQQFSTKSRFYKNLDLTIVTPSKWLLQNAKKSKLLGETDAINIFNGFPIGIYHKYEKSITRSLLKINQNSYIILFGAAYPTYRKGYHFLKKLLMSIPSTIKGREVEVVFFGPVPTEKFDSNVPINYMGFIDNQSILAMLYSAADVSILLSMEDNLPNVAVESICCGTPVVAFDVGGLADIVEHKKNGWLARPFDLEDIVKGIEFVSRFSENDLETIAFNAQQKFNDITQAMNYLNLYTKLLNNENIDNLKQVINPFVTNFEKLLRENNFYLFQNFHITNFSGLDSNYLQKIVNLYEIQNFEFIKLMIIRILFTFEFTCSNITLITTKTNFFLTELPTLFKINFVIIEPTRHIPKRISNGKNFIVETNIDNVNNLKELDIEKNIILVLSYSDMLSYFEKIIKIFKETSINFYLFVNEIPSDDSELLKLINRVHPRENVNLESTQTQNTFLVLHKPIPEKKYLFGSVKLDLINFTERIKSINFVKNYNVEYPKISIVTPNYNQSRYIETCIRNIINQNYPNLEYIIIDGGSTDNSIEIIKKYDKHIHFWVSEKDNGQYDAINKGFSRATGDIFAWLNADDFYLPGAFFFVAEFFSTFNKFNWLTTNNLTALSRTGFLQTNWGSKEYSLKKILKGDFDKPFIQQEATFWTRDLWNKAGGFVSTQNYMASDLELWIRFFLHTNLGVLECPLAVFRFQPESKTGKNFNFYLEESYKIIEYYKKTLSNNQIISTKNGNSIFIKFIELIEKSKLKILGHHLEKIIQEYENLEYPPESKFIKREFEIWISKLKILYKFWKNQN